MKPILRHSCFEYEILDKRHSPLEFKDIPSAVAFLRQFENDPVQVEILRSLIPDGASNSPQISTEEIIQECASQMLNGRIRILRSLDILSGGGSGEAATTTASQQAADREKGPAKKTAWVEFRVLDDETGMPIEGVELMIKLPDGRIERKKTDLGGYVEINDTVEGECQVSCDMSDAELSTSYTFIRMGST